MDTSVLDRAGGVKYSDPANVSVVCAANLSADTANLGWAFQDTPHGEGGGADFRCPSLGERR